MKLNAMKFQYRKVFIKTKYHFLFELLFFVVFKIHQISL
jgi:hypothetical protein